MTHWIRSILAAAVLGGLVLALGAGPALADKQSRRDKEHRELREHGADRKPDIPTAPAEYQAMQNPHTSDADIKRGARYYKGKCAECHGDEGEGDADEPEVPVFGDAARMATRSDGQLFYIIMFGAGEDAEMEAYGPESDAGLSEQKVWQIVAYIRTLVK